MANDQVRIKHPKRTATAAIVKKPCFFIHGLASGTDIKGVRGWIKGVQSYQARTVLFRSRPAGGLAYRWIMRFDVPGMATGAYTLVVVGSTASGSHPPPSSDIPNSDEDLSINLRATDDSPRTAGHGYGAPTITYPEDSHQLSAEEKEFFVTEGTEDNALIEGKVGTKLHDYIYDDPEIHYWTAHFSNLTETGVQVLRVEDSLELPASKYVIVPQ